MKIKKLITLIRSILTAIEDSDFNRALLLEACLTAQGLWEVLDPVSARARIKAGAWQKTIVLSIMLHMHVHRENLEDDVDSDRVIGFLAARWGRIQTFCPEIGYTEADNYIANQVCVEIAKDLFPRRYHQMLMPTLESLSVRHTDSTQPLSAFIVSDDARRLIHRFDCIVNEVTNEECTELTDLTPAERRRVLGGALSIEVLKTFVAEIEKAREDGDTEDAKQTEFIDTVNACIAEPRRAVSPLFFIDEEDVLLKFFVLLEADLKEHIFMRMSNAALLRLSGEKLAAILRQVLASSVRDKKVYHVLMSMEAKTIANDETKLVLLSFLGKEFLLQQLSRGHVFFSAKNIMQQNISYLLQVLCFRGEVEDFSYQAFSFFLRLLENPDNQRIAIQWLLSNEAVFPHFIRYACPQVQGISFSLIKRLDLGRDTLLRHYMDLLEMCMHGGLPDTLSRTDYCFIFKYLVAQEGFIVTVFTRYFEECMERHELAKSEVTECAEYKSKLEQVEQDFYADLALVPTLYPREDLNFLIALKDVAYPGDISRADYALMRKARAQLMIVTHELQYYADKRAENPDAGQLAHSKQNKLAAVSALIAYLQNEESDFLARRKTYEKELMSGKLGECVRGETFDRKCAEAFSTMPRERRELLASLQDIEHALRGYFNHQAAAAGAAAGIRSSLGLR